VAVLAIILAVVVGTSDFGAFSFKSFEGATYATTNVEGAQRALEAKLPAGSDAGQYVDLFRKMGGNCDYTGNFAGDRSELICRYVHGIFAMSEWTCVVKLDVLTDKSMDVLVSFAITGF
jgi:hypothetical protein